MSHNKLGCLGTKLCSGTVWKSYPKNNFFAYMKSIFLLEDAVLIINFELYVFLIFLEIDRNFLLNDLKEFGDNFEDE